MSQLSELAALVKELSILVRENREEIAELKARVRQLEVGKVVYGGKPTGHKYNAYEPITVSIKPDTRNF